MRRTGAPRGIGGLAGRLGRKVLKKDDEPKPGPGNRATFMTTQHELLKVSTSVNSADLQVPAGFKQK
ncbi:MAG: hypothetical protein ABL971_08550 [Vicinamibacterales bacterium]